jgi:hypothetical protein
MDFFGCQNVANAPCLVWVGGCIQGLPDSAMCVGVGEFAAPPLAALPVCRPTFG